MSRYKTPPEAPLDMLPRVTPSAEDSIESTTSSPATDSRTGDASSTMMQAIGSMRNFDIQKLSDSLHEQHTLFWRNSPSEEERDFRLAKFGHLVSVILLTFLGTIEFVFVATLIWYFLK